MQSIIKTYQENPPNSAHPDRIQTDKHVIFLKPRISAAKLAEYIIADPVRQEAIVKSCKKAPIMIVTQMNQMRQSLPGFIEDGTFNKEAMLERAEELQNAPFNNDWARRNNLNSAEALKRLAVITAKMGITDANVINTHDKMSALNISGVRVSVKPALIFATVQRGVSKVGGIMLNTTKDAKMGLHLTARNEHCAGDYLACLLLLTLQLQAKNIGPVVGKNCYAIDIFRDTVYPAPTAVKTLTKQMEAACKMIQMRWDSTDVGVTPEDEDDWC